MKKQVIIIVSIVLAVLLLLTGGVVAVGVAIYNNLPSVVAFNSVTGAVTDLMERDEISPILSTLQQGSIELGATLDSSKMGEDIRIGELKGSIGGKLYFSDNALFVENLNAKIENPKENYTFDVNAEMYLSDEYAYVSNDKYLGGTYGIYKKGLAESFKRSFIADELSDDECEQIISILEAYESEDTDDFTKEGKKFIEEYANIIKKSIAKNAEFTSETKEISVGGELVKSRIVNVTVDGDAVYATISDLYEELKKDKSLRKYVIKYNDRFEDMGLFDGNEVDEAAAAEFYDEMLFEFGKEINRMRLDLVGSEGALIIRIATPSLSSTLRKITVSVDTGSGNIDDIFEIDLGKDGIAKTDKISVVIDEDETYSYEIKENTSDAYEAVLTYTNNRYTNVYVPAGEATMSENKPDNNNKTVIAELNINKDDDTFKLSLENGDVSIGGNWSTKSKATTIVIKEFTADSVEIKDGVEITLVIDQKDSMPKPKKEKDVKNVFELTKEDVENIAEKFETAFSGESNETAK